MRRGNCGVAARRDTSDLGTVPSAPRSDLGRWCVSVHLASAGSVDDVVRRALRQGHHREGGIHATD